MNQKRLDAWGNSCFRKNGKAKGWFLLSKAEQMKNKVHQEMTKTQRNQILTEEEQETLEAWQETTTTTTTTTFPLNLDQDSEERKITHTCLNGGSCSISFQDLSLAYEYICSDFANNILISISEFALAHRPVYFDIDGWSLLKPDASNTLGIEICAQRALAQFFPSNHKLYISRPSKIKEKTKPDGSVWYKVALHLVAKEAIVDFAEHLYIAEAFCQELEKAQTNKELQHQFDVENVRHIVDMDVLESEKKSHLRLNFTQKAEPCIHCQSSRTRFLSLVDQLKLLRQASKMTQKTQEKIKVLEEDKKKCKFEVEKCKECSGIGKKFSNSYYSLFRILDEQGQEDNEEFDRLFKFSIEDSNFVQKMIYQLQELNIRIEKHKRTDFTLPSSVQTIQSHVFDPSTQTWLRKDPNIQRVHHTTSSSSLSSSSSVDEAFASDYITVGHLLSSDPLCNEWIHLISQYKAEWNDIAQVEPAKVILFASASERDKLFKSYKWKTQRNEPTDDIRPNFFVRIPIANSGGGLCCLNVSSQNLPRPFYHKTSPIYFVVKFSYSGLGIWQKCTNRNRVKATPGEGRETGSCYTFSHLLDVHRDPGSETSWKEWKEDIFQRFVSQHPTWLKIQELAQKQTLLAPLPRFSSSSLLEVNPSSFQSSDSYFFRRPDSDPNNEAENEAEKIDFQLEQVSPHTEKFEHYQQLVHFLHAMKKRIHRNLALFHRGPFVSSANAGSLFPVSQLDEQIFETPIEVRNPSNLTLSPPVPDRFTFVNQTVVWPKLHQEQMNPVDNLIADINLKESIEEIDLILETKRITQSSQKKSKSWVETHRPLPSAIQGSCQNGLCLAPIGSIFGEYTYVSLKHFEGISSFFSFKYVRSYNDWYQSRIIYLREKMIQDKREKERAAAQDALHTVEQKQSLRVEEERKSSTRRKELFDLFYNKKKLESLKKNKGSRNVQATEALKATIEDQETLNTSENWKTFSRVCYVKNQQSTNPCAFLFINAAKNTFRSSFESFQHSFSTLKSSSSSSCFHSLALPLKIQQVQDYNRNRKEEEKEIYFPVINFFTVVDQELEEAKRAQEEKERKNKEEGIKRYFGAKEKNLNEIAEELLAPESRPKKKRLSSAQLASQIANSFQKNQELILKMKQNQETNLFSMSNLDTFERIFSQVCPSEYQKVFHHDPTINDHLFQVMAELSQQVEAYEGEYKEKIKQARRYAKRNCWSTDPTFNSVNSFLNAKRG